MISAEMEAARRSKAAKRKAKQNSGHFGHGNEAAKRKDHELRHLEVQQQQQRAPVAAADSEKRAAGTAAAQAPSADSASARSHPFPLGRRVRGANRMDRNELGTIVAWRYQNTRCAALLRR